MNRQLLDEDISQLEHRVLDMTSRAETMVSKAVDALCKLDDDLAHEVMHADDEIDRLDIEIEAQCLRLLALQQPMGRDLRVIGAAMKIITDVERIGDLAVDIAKITMKIEREMGDASLVDIPKMANLARKMVRFSLDAFVKRDVSHLKDIAVMEDETDVLYRELRSQIHDYMRSHPSQVVSASWLLLAVHHIERIADHALNIAERVNFMVTGELEQISPSHRSDHTA
ncbi:MAG TPA: phosphate signaling complex protein PhoU [Fimbriimonadaceae bacterium]|nr:phosphate signaling complex protein PhoU [Fimbriimonadaceae bacterium]